MTIKQLTKIVNGRLVPSDNDLDADVIEISMEKGNILEAKEDGLFCKFTPYLYTTDSTTTINKPPKIFVGVAVANGDGDWSINYSHVGFTTIPMVTATGQAIGTAAADRRFATLGVGQPTLTGCSGRLASASSAGLLAAMTMVSAAGNVNVIAIGY